MIKSQLTFSVFLTFLIVGCNENPFFPEYGTISGVINFTGVWPETGNISISLNTTWPEITGAPYAFKTIDLSDLNQDSLYSYNFENVAFNTYQGIIISWKDPYDNNSATNQHVIGGYGATKEVEFEDAESITVSSSNHEIKDLNFTATLDLILETIPAESGTLSGTITFSGNWADGTVFISLNSVWPLQTTPDYYSTIAYDNLIDDKYNYSIENISFGTYIIAVIWLNPESDPGTNPWVTLGAYNSETPPDFADAESVMITVTNYQLSGLNFTAIFDN